MDNTWNNSVRSSDARTEPSPENDANATAGTVAPAITIATVAHNSAPALPSLLAPVTKGMPVIVVDNGSRDSSKRATKGPRRRTLC